MVMTPKEGVQKDTSYEMPVQEVLGKEVGVKAQALTAKNKLIRNAKTVADKEGAPSSVLVVSGVWISRVSGILLIN